VDVDLIRSQRFSVLLDANHGAGSLMGRALLHELGCRAQILGDMPNGKFVHPPEPTAENLAGVCQQVTVAGAAVGFCQDPDADRLALIDEQGSYIGEEYTLALCVDHVLRKRQGPIVTNCSTSRMCQDLAEQHGVELFRSKVGEANVADLMIQKQAVFGGEGNGGPMDPRVGYVRDSFVGMVLVLEALAEQNEPISALVQRIPSYAIEKTKVFVDGEQVGAALDAVERHFADAVADRMDGLRLDWPDKWLLVRASNTEPIVRVIAEGRNREAGQSLCRQAAQAISAATG
jgi:phosphomannomutase